MVAKFEAGKDHLLRAPGKGTPQMPALAGSCLSFCGGLVVYFWNNRRAARCQKAGKPNKRTMESREFELTSRKDQAHALRQHLNPLPRSVTRSGQFELLDGEWKFDLDLEDNGISERWYLNDGFVRTAQWPGSVESHLAVAKDASSSTTNVRRVAPEHRDLEYVQRRLGVT